VDDAQQQPGQHQADRDLGVDARPPRRGVIKLADLIAQPAKIENPIDPDQDVLVRQQLTEASGDEQLRLPAPLLTQSR
jgi:hypothetical protein